MNRFEHYGWPFFDERHRQLAADADAWVKGKLTKGKDADATCRYFVRELGKAGFLDHCVSATPDVRSIALLREVFAYHHGLADFAFVMQGLGSGPIVLAGSEAQKKAWLPRVAAGEAIAAFALSEPDAGSDVAALIFCCKKRKQCMENQRHEDLDLQRRHRRFLRDFCQGGRRNLRIHRRGGRRRCLRAHRHHRAAPDGDGEVQGCEGRADRRGGAGLQAGDAQPGRVPHHGGRRRARLRAARAGRVAGARQGPEDVRRAAGRPADDAGQARRHGHRHREPPRC